MSETLTAALDYAQAGWAVFPADERKRPRTAHGLHDATTERAEIEGWWRRWPDANVAIRTGPESGLLVLDVDGDEGADTLHDLEGSHGAMPLTASVSTPRGGEHYYPRLNGRRIANSAGKLGPGVDVRGDGGYVLAPPSIGANGRRYELDERAPLADPPAWLLELIQNGPARATSPPIGEEIPEGQRNETLASVAGTMRRRGLDGTAILAALRETNRLRCRPPLSESEVEAIQRASRATHRTSRAARTRATT